MPTPPNKPAEGGAWTVLEQGPMKGGAWSVLEAPPPPLPLIPLTPSEGNFPLRKPPVAPSPVQKGAVGISELREIFDTLDLNHDGKVTHAEFIKGLKANPKIAATLKLPQNVAPARDAYARQFNEIDIDGDKTLSFDEMLRYYAPWAVAPLDSPGAPKLISGPSPEPTPPSGPVMKRAVRSEATATKAAPPPPVPMDDLRSVAFESKISDVRAPVDTAAKMARAAPPPSPPSPAAEIPASALSSQSPPRSQSPPAPARDPLASVPAPREPPAQTHPVVTDAPTPPVKVAVKPDGKVTSVSKQSGGNPAAAVDQSVEPPGRQEEAGDEAAPPEPVMSKYEQRQSILRESGFLRDKSRTEGTLFGYDGASSEWKQRRFVLDGDEVSYRQKDASAEGKFGASVPIHLYSSATLEVLRGPHFNRENCLILRTKDDGDVYLLSSGTREERTGWVVALEDAGVSLITKQPDNFLAFSFPCIFGKPF